MRLLILSRFLFFIVLIIPWVDRFEHWVVNQESKAKIYFQSQSINKEYDGTLSYQIVNIDAFRKLISLEESTKVKLIIEFYFKSLEDCSRGEKTSDFLLCADDVLKQYFSYKETVVFSHGMLNRQTDCDINSYLLYDASDLFGYQVYIRYLPGHALISFEEDGKYFEFETTNKKHRISEYDERSDITIPFYHKWHSKDDLLDVYDSIIFREIEKKYSDYILYDENLLNNEMGLNFYFYQKQLKGLTTDDDVNYMKQSIAKGYEREMFYYVLSDWFFKQGNIPKSREYLSYVRDCTLFCTEMQERIGELPVYFPLILYQAYVEVLSDHNVKVLFQTQQYFIFLMLFMILLLVGEVLYYFYQWCKKTTIEL